MVERNAYAAKRCDRPKAWKSRRSHDEFGDEFGDRQRNRVWGQAKKRKIACPLSDLPFRTPASLCGRLPLSEGRLGFPTLVIDLISSMALAWHVSLSHAKHQTRRKLIPRVDSDKGARSLRDAKITAAMHELRKPIEGQKSRV